MAAVRRNWHYHAPSETVSWNSTQDEDGTRIFEVTPVLQEIWGGEDDGKRVWAGFDFDIHGFSHECGVEFLDFGAASRCQADVPIPYIGIKGRYFSEPFFLKVGLEPAPDSEIREIVDALRGMLRPFNERDEPDQ